MKPDQDLMQRKPERVERLFDEMAVRYDFLNHLFSLGLDTTWRFRAVRALCPKISGPLLDGATGTGDMAISLARRFDDRHVTGVDFSRGMVRIGQAKVQRRGLDSRIDLLVGDLTALPLDENRFAGATVAFGIRNVQRRQDALKEMPRVLKPGGRLLILEFAMPTWPVFGFVYRFYFRHCMPAAAALFGLARTYRYLFESVNSFASRKEFVETMQGAGFGDVTATPYTLGTVILYSGVAEK